MLDISPVLDFVARTGEHCVFFNPEDRGFFVVSSFKEYERLMPKRMSPYGGSPEGRPGFGEGGGGTMGSTPSQVREEPFVEPWATNAPSFSPEPPV